MNSLFRSFAFAGIASLGLLQFAHAATSPRLVRAIACVEQPLTATREPLVLQILRGETNDRLEFDAVVQIRQGGGQAFSVAAKGREGSGRDAIFVQFGYGELIVENRGGLDLHGELKLSGVAMEMACQPMSDENH